jgi:hypothetical protein
MPRMIVRWLIATALVAGGVLLQPASASARHSGHGGGHGGHASGGHSSGSGHSAGRHGGDHHRHYSSGHYGRHYSSDYRYYYGGLRVGFYGDYAGCYDPYYGYFACPYAYPPYPYPGYSDIAGPADPYGSPDASGNDPSEDSDVERRDSRARVWRDDVDRDHNADGRRSRITVVPEDAMVYVDGHLYGSGREAHSVALTPGQHRIEVVRPGFSAADREVQVDEGRSLAIDIELEPLARETH